MVKSTKRNVNKKNKKSVKRRNKKAGDTPVSGSASKPKPFNQSSYYVIRNTKSQPHEQQLWKPGFLNPKVKKYYTKDSYENAKKEFMSTDHTDDQLNSWKKFNKGPTVPGIGSVFGGKRRTRKSRKSRKSRRTRRR